MFYSATSHGKLYIAVYCCILFDVLCDIMNVRLLINSFALITHSARANCLMMYVVATMFIAA